MTELYFFLLKKYIVDTTLSNNELIKFLFLIRLLKFLNFSGFKPIKIAGSIPTSESTEYLPPI